MWLGRGRVPMYRLLHLVLVLLSSRAASVSAFRAPLLDVSFGGRCKTIFVKSPLYPWPSQVRTSHAAPSSLVASKISSSASGGTSYDFTKIRQTAETRMQKTVDHLMQRFGAIRAGQASVSMLDRVEVSWCGSRACLNKAAHVSQVSALELMVRPFDPKLVGDIVAAIIADDAKLNVIPDGEKIRVLIPPLSKERREDFLKQVRQLGEEARVALRNIRRDCVDAVREAEKRSGLSKDLSRSQQDEAQKMLDGAMKKLDMAVANKEKSLLESK